MSCSNGTERFCSVVLHAYHLDIASQSFESNENLALYFFFVQPTSLFQINNISSLLLYREYVAATSDKILTYIHNLLLVM